jgi:hypothetical protein
VVVAQLSVYGGALLSAIPPVFLGKLNQNPISVFTAKSYSAPKAFSIRPPIVRCP